MSKLILSDMPVGDIKSGDQAVLTEHGWAINSPDKDDVQLTHEYNSAGGFVDWIVAQTGYEKVGNKITGPGFPQGGIDIMELGHGNIPPQSLPTMSDYDSIVFIGASIIKGAFGTNNAPSTEATTLLNVSGVTVYGNGHSGYTIDSIIPKAAESVAAFPSRTLFVVHAGGNNLSGAGDAGAGTKGNWDLITTTQRQKAIDDYTSLKAVFAGREDDVIFCPLTQRDYNRAGYALGTDFDSNKFSSEVISPHYTPRFQNSNGFPMLDLYGMLINHEWYLSEDGIHMSISGTPKFRENIISTLRSLLVDEAVPTPYAHNIPYASAPVPKAVSIGFHYNVNSNIISSGDFTGTPITLVTDDRTTEVSVTPTSTGTISGRGDGYLYGDRPFDWTLDSDPTFYGVAWGGAGEEMHLAFTGLQANTTYSVELQAYREANEARYTELVDQGDTNNVSVVNSSDLPPKASATIQVTTNGLGELSVTIRAQSGSAYCYASAMRLVPV